MRHRLVLFPACVFAGVLFLGPVGLRGQNPAQGQAVGQGASINNEDCAVCHEEVAKGFDRNPHAVVEKGAKWGKKNSCETCHGPGGAHAEGGGDKAKIISFKGVESGVYSGRCLGCHRTGHDLMAYKGSSHAKGGLGCQDCHRVHGGERRGRLLRQPANDLCLGCHVQRRADFSKPYHHRVKEGAMRCTDCHQPHSGLERRQVKVSGLGEAVCVKCHTDKGGPFVFEHAPTKIRDCQSCHEPHGSVNARMLVRSTVRALCIECHSRSVSALTAQPPAFHNLGNPRYQSCTTCHVKVHGSNASRLFLR